jgi:cardiolipin synthase A/B
MQRLPVSVKPWGKPDAHRRRSGTPIALIALHTERSMPKWLSPSTWGRGPPAPNSAALSPAQLHEQALTRSLGHGLTRGNRIELLLDGPQTYASMFDAIDAARDSILVESYIVDADGPGAEFARRLIERRRDGVRVHLLFDGVGSMRTPRNYFERLESEGVALCEYRPLRRLLACIDAAAHRRNHRKIMVIDGRVGFIGGLNISREYAFGSAPNLLRSKDEGGAGGGWRDSHVRVQGPVVAELQALFVAHWNCHAPVRVTLPPHGAALGPRGTQPAARSRPW